jgi:hypothetical protein
LSIKSKEIINALAKLDVEDDGSWTDEGQPSLEAVQAAANDDTITRELIVSVALGFDRDAAREAKAERDMRGQEQLDHIDAAKGLDEATSVDPDEPAPSTEDVLSLSEEERRAELQGGVDKWKQAIADVEQAIKAARAKCDRYLVNLDKATMALEAEFPPLRQADMTRQWLESEARKRVERKDGFLMRVSNQAPIDAVMRRPTGYGNKRPQIPHVSTHG